VEIINREISKIKNLPSLPEESIRIITAVNDPDISIDELVQVISQSPSLTARLLGLANSAFFGHPGKISDLRIAIIQVLGISLVKSLALSIVLNTEFDTSKCPLFDPRLFWHHALITAQLAQQFCRKINVNKLEPNTLYTAGLLLNIGLLAAIYIAPEKINEVFLETDYTEGSVSARLKKILGEDQYAMGGILMDRWKLPTIYQTITKNFKNPDFEGEEKTAIALLQLCHWVAAYIVTDKYSDCPDFSGFLPPLSLSQTIFDTTITDIIDRQEGTKELASAISGL